MKDPLRDPFSLGVLRSLEPHTDLLFKRLDKPKLKSKGGKKKKLRYDVNEEQKV